MLFHCKQFDVHQHKEVFKITTDATLLGALAWNDVFNEDTEKEILEIGTGTGIISLMIAQRFPQISIHGIDNNIEAKKLTSTNFQNSPYSNRLSCEVADFLDFDRKFDHIIINPPYFQNDTPAKLDVNKSSRHLKNITYPQMVNVLLEIVENEGTIEIIHPIRYLDEIITSIQSNNASIERIIKIRHNKDSEVKNCITRLVKSSRGKVRESFFELRNLNNSFTDDYIKLLRPFINV